VTIDRFHRLDIDYSFLTDAEVEKIWRHPDHSSEDIDAATLRQLVLRTLPVIEATTAEEGVQLGFSAEEGERARDEVALKLYARLRSDRRVPSVRALAHALTRDVVRDQLRHRHLPTSLFAPTPPRLRLIGREERS
jgi:hypothetical protein